MSTQGNPEVQLEQKGHTTRNSFAKKVEELSGQKVVLCYQCGKCSAGCPLASEMDLLPNQVIRMVQLGEEEKALSSKAIWLCAACETCSIRCPQEVELARVMDALRQISYQKGLYNPQVKDVIAFHKAFLDVVKSQGRLFELGMVSLYKLKTGRLFQDLEIAPNLFLKGKLKLLPHKINEQSALKRLFERCQAEEEKSS